jgi:hypothetical protein
MIRTKLVCLAARVTSLAVRSIRSVGGENPNATERVATELLPVSCFDHVAKQAFIGEAAPRMLPDAGMSYAKVNEEALTFICRAECQI